MQRSFSMSELATKSAFAEILKAKQAQKTPMNLEDLINKVAEKDYECASKVFALCNMITSRDEYSTWEPEEIRIMRPNAKDKDLRNKIGVENLYFVNEENTVPEDWKFFPLFVHTTHRWWPEMGSSEERLICDSIDGKVGLRYEGAYQNTLVTCGHASCPNFPARGGKTKEQKCRFLRTVYVVDSQFTNIYKLDVSTWSFKHFLDKLENKTRVGGNAFGSSNLHWFQVTTKEDGNQSGQNQYFSLINHTGNDEFKLTEAEHIVVQQLQLGMGTYHNYLVSSRKEKYEEKDVDLSDVPENEVIDVANDEEPEHVDL